MTWKPISESELAALIDEAELRMEAALLKYWQRVKVRPVKWSLPPWGDQGGGFWVVAVVGQECVWYNDIEEGFNTSRYAEPGSIKDYWCNQGGLDDRLRGQFEGTDSGRFGPPVPIEPEGS